MQTKTRLQWLLKKNMTIFGHRLLLFDTVARTPFVDKYMRSYVERRHKWLLLLLGVCNL